MKDKRDPLHKYAISISQCYPLHRVIQFRLIQDKQERFK